MNQQRSILGSGVTWDFYHDDVGPHNKECKSHFKHNELRRISLVQPYHIFDVLIKHQLKIDNLLQFFLISTRIKAFLPHKALTGSIWSDKRFFFESQT
jgi:hypothetical protein